MIHFSVAHLLLVVFTKRSINLALLQARMGAKVVIASAGFVQDTETTAYNHLMKHSLCLHNVLSSFIMSPLRRHIFVCFMAKSAFFRGGEGVSALAP